MNKIKKIYYIIYNKLKNENFECALVNTNTIFNAQMKNNGYNRLDIIVRLLVLEEEIGMNNCGWRLYKKMQTKRCLAKQSELTIDDRIIKYKNLINSWKENGYDNVTPIVINKKKQLIDGSHRIALSIFYKQKLIKCKITNIDDTCDYSAEWFKNNGFCKSEMQIINNKYEEVRKQMMYNN